MKDTPSAPSDALLALLEAQLGLDAVRVEQHLVEDLGLESADLVQLVALVEEEFGIVIPEEALPRLHTVADLLAFVPQGR
ncbi:MAG: acyl carrier protein [Deltaproteobacteria bacterium]|nr:acyl carrier protein [Deltaproteobacteria bacterium]